MNSTIREIAIGVLVLLAFANCAKKSVEEVNGYHFHVYFYEGVKHSVNEAMAFHDEIEAQIKNGFMKNCIVKAVNHGPYGPHQVGNFETCCNKTSISQALSFFMLNHGNLSVLFHPLTRYEKKDHSGREMFLGPRIPMFVDDLADDLMDYADRCDSADQGLPFKAKQAARVNAGKKPQS